MAKKKASTRRRKAAPRKPRRVSRRTASRRPPAKARAKSARKPTRRAKSTRPRPRPVKAAARKPVASKPKPVPRSESKPATLERRRRQLPESERLENPPRIDERLVSSARAGHDELKAQLSRITGGGPVLTAGDVDAHWQDADSVGDESPGGDNPTPDQDRVDDIGKALGIQYNDDEELQGGDEVTERDKHRWELDPASSDDWPHKE